MGCVQDTWQGEVRGAAHFPHCISCILAPVLREEARAHDRVQAGYWSGGHRPRDEPLGRGVAAVPLRPR